MPRPAGRAHGAGAEGRVAWIVSVPVDRRRLRRSRGLRASVAGDTLGPTMHELLQAARRSPAFRGMTEVQLQDLALMARLVDHPEGSDVFREGDRGDAMYVIASGIVRVRKSGTLLARLGPGDVLGEMALLLDAPRSATASAETPLRLCRLGRDGFDELLESCDAVAVVLLRNLAMLACERLRRLDEEMALARAPPPG